VNQSIRTATRACIALLVLPFFSSAFGATPKDQNNNLHIYQQLGSTSVDVWGWDHFDYDMEEDDPYRSTVKGTPHYNGTQSTTSNPFSKSETACVNQVLQTIRQAMQKHPSLQSVMNAKGYKIQINLNRFNNIDDYDSYDNESQGYFGTQVVKTISDSSHLYIQAAYFGKEPDDDMSESAHCRSPSVQEIVNATDPTPTAQRQANENAQLRQSDAQAIKNSEMKTIQMIQSAPGNSAGRMNNAPVDTNHVVPAQQTPPGNTNESPPHAGAAVGSP
jgi:hypothetical protein